MKLVMTLLVRDEEDIIKENIDFHRSQGVDFFIVTDNKSVDSTPEILKEYAKEGILFYILETEDNYDQHRWVTRMARMAYTEFGADWVINNDADEFWFPKKGNLKQTFEHIPSQFNVLKADRHNFIPVNMDTSPFFLQMIYREKISLNPIGKPLSPKVAHQGDSQIKVSQGNHRVENINQCINTEELIEIFHFPMRTYQQFANKISKGGAAYERNVSLPKNSGKTWKNLYKEYQTHNNLNNYYDRHLYSKDRIKDELKSSLILEDKRLANYLVELYKK